MARAQTLTVAAWLLGLTLAASESLALPSGEQVTGGTARVQRAGPALTVTQSTQNVAINWQAFGIAPSESVRFNQPGANSIALNRVLGQDPSQIFGSLSANGQVFLLNPNGVLFGKGAQVNVGGLVASTLNMTDQDFMAGRHVLSAGAMAGSVVNQAAMVAAEGGYVVLIAPQVSNTGSIIAHRGNVALAAGEKVTLTLNAGSLFGVSVDRGTLNALVDNNGAIHADGGAVILTSKAMDQVSRSVVNNSGIIEAISLSSTNGIIRLEGDEARNSGTLSATGVAGRGGQISVTGDTVEITAGATIDASGNTGGIIEIGGGWQGSGSLSHATNVAVASGAMLRANATGQGDGGTIAVWSDGATRVYGILEATGAGSGIGGRIETSGHVLDVTGIAVNASAPLGPGGSWLLDPYNLTVSGAATTATEAPAGTWTSDAGGSIVLNTNINTALNSGTSVVLQTSGALGDGFGNGDIAVAAPIAKTAGANASLTLKAAGSVIVNAGISSTVGAMDVTLNSNVLGGGGYVNVAAPITTQGGNLIIGGGATPLTGAAAGTAAQASGVLINFSGALSAGGGDITINGTGRNTNSNSNFGIQQLAAIGTTGTGSITLNGTGGGTGNNEMGVVSSANIAAGTGNISITGAASPTATFIANHGVNFAAGTTSTTGAGTITVDGTATGSATGTNSHGVVVQGAAAVRAADGLISVTGHNNSIGTSTANRGVYLTGTGVIESTGTGGVSVLGFGGGTGGGGGNYGVYWDAANAIRTTGTGAISITGTGGGAGGSGVSNYGVNANGALTAIGGTITISGTGGSAGGSGGLSTGVNIAAPLAGAGGAISITGVGGNSGGTGNTGISQVAAITNTGTGNITLNGTGGGSGIQETGILSNANITAGTGNISVTAAASPAAVGSASHGVQFRGGTRSTTGAGTITVAGTARGTGTGFDTYGVSVVGGAVISTVDGLVSVTGTNNSTGTGGGNNGVFVTDAGSTIRSTGVGSISITGTQGSSTSGSNFGILLTSVSAGAGTLTLTSAGAVTSTGALTAANLNLLGVGGTHVLTNGANAVGILAAKSGSVNYAENGDLVIGTVDGTAGVTATGSVLVRSTGNLALASGAGVSAGGAGDALVLAADGNFINNAGAGGLSAAGGRWLVYSNSPAGSIENGLTAAAGSTLPRLYNRTYAANGPSTISEAGNHLIYSAQPALTVTADNSARSYGDPNLAFTYTPSGFVNDDGVIDNAASANLTGSPSLTTGATSTSNVGTYAINAGAGTLASGAGYRFNFADGFLAVTPRPLLIDADDKSKNQGAVNPPLTATGSGFASGEDFGDLAGALNLATTALISSPDGIYPIIPSGLTSTNYNISYTNGVLVINAPAASNADANAALASALFETVCENDGGDFHGELLPVRSSNCVAAAGAQVSLRVIGAGMRLPEGPAAGIEQSNDRVPGLAVR